MRVGSASQSRALFCLVKCEIVESITDFMHKDEVERFLVEREKYKSE